MMILFTAMVALNAAPVKANEALTVSAETKAALTQGEADALTARLHEIHRLAQGKLSRNEKTDLRREVLSIRERLADPVGGGIYISAGALILIIILLIIIL